MAHLNARRGVFTQRAALLVPPPQAEEPGALDLPRVSWEGGPAYYAQFPKANAAGWTDPDFFPIAVFLGKPDVGHPALLKALGINTYMCAEHQPPITQVTNEGLFVLAQYGEWTTGEVGTNPNVVGWFVADECEQGEGGCWISDTATEWDRLALFQSWCDDIRSRNDGRFLFANFGNGVLRTFWAPNAMPDFMQSIDGCSVDKYAYTSPQVRYEMGRSFDWSGTEAQADSSAAYGWFVDQMRNFDDPINRRPIWGFVETKMPFLGEATAEIILYAEIEGAIWSAITHEARGIAYFQHNGFYTGWTGNDPNTGAPPIGSTYSLIDCEVGLRDAVTAINAKVTSLAPVLNTQSYEWDFGATGIVTMLKELDGYAYIIASLGKAASTGSKTFTLPDGINDTSVVVVGESRSISVTAGQFSDSFPNEYTHHVYKISLSAL